MTGQGPTPEQEELLAQLAAAGAIRDPRVEEAMLAVPRHLFVPKDMVDMAYEDQPLPVGHGQTISAPHMVAMMTSALQLEPGQNVLEVGTGQGYHCAVLKAMVGDEGTVTSIEYVEELANAARENLAKAGFDVEVRHGDGYVGAPDLAPFDAILVTCAIPRLPQSLVEQLAERGHIVAPIGHTDCVLIVGRKRRGRLQVDELSGCRFVNAQGRLGSETGAPPPTSF